jgi:hypothetical protein
MKNAPTLRIRQPGDYQMFSQEALLQEQAEILAYIDYWRPIDRQKTIRADIQLRAVERQLRY